MQFERANDVAQLVCDIIHHLKLRHIVIDQVACVRSYGSIARAYARIWGLARIFQIAFGYKSVYVIEVLSEHYDRLHQEDKIKTLIHELLHIPKTFSGALLPHRGRSRRIGKRVVDRWYQVFKANDL